VSGHYSTQNVSAWFVNDEVGSVVGHSDKPNVRMTSFLYSKTNSADDILAFTVLWPISDIGVSEALSRDKLFGFDESQFRSARLRVWFETPDEYYKQQLDLWRAIKLDNIEGLT
jgi:hypothetical protein